MPTVRFYFDFISPYSWLALHAVRSMPPQGDTEWDLRPVVYGKLLDATGLVGPAETPAKRRYTFHDVLRCAAAAGLRCTGPPVHPFRSLEALRTACLFRDRAEALDLCFAIADAAWGQGRDLTQTDVLCDVVQRFGLDATDLDERIAAEPAKKALFEMTSGAVDSGVFGVPTFELDGELFWGHDRLEQLARRLSGEPRPGVGDVEAILGRPRGIDRRRSPAPRGGKKSGPA